MNCRRCHSAMVLETFVDLTAGSPMGVFMGWRCVACGAILDPVIATHQCATPTQAPPRLRVGRPKASTSKATDKMKVALREGATSLLVNRTMPCKRP